MLVPPFFVVFSLSAHFPNTKRNVKGALRSDERHGGGAPLGNWMIDTFSRTEKRVMGFPTKNGIILVVTVTGWGVVPNDRLIMSIVKTYFQN